MTSECSHRNIYWFYFLVEARFHQFVLAIFQASESHFLRFSYCIYRAYVLMYWVGLVEGPLIVTYTCAQCTVVFLSCLYLGWCMFMYLYNVLWCMPSPPYVFFSCDARIASVCFLFEYFKFIDLDIAQLDHNTFDLVLKWTRFRVLYKGSSVVCTFKIINGFGISNTWSNLIDKHI